MMGIDHIKRIARRVNGATLVAVVEPDEDRSKIAASLVPAVRIYDRLEDAIEAEELDAVLVATPAPFHEAVLIPAIEAGLAVLCEKPLAPTPEESLRIIAAEQRLGRPHIQVGFMRRFDKEHMELRELIASERLGRLLALHCIHRNPSAPPGFTNDRVIFDSVVHELDSVPWLVGDPIASIEIRYPRRNGLAEPQLNDPQFILIETSSGVLADVEINVNAGFGYQVRVEAVFERGIAEIGRPFGIAKWVDGTYVLSEHDGFESRFASAYDTEVQRWVDAVRAGRIDGPSSWDGYLASVAAAAGVEAQRTDGRVDVRHEPRPTFYDR